MKIFKIVLQRIYAFILHSDSTSMAFALLYHTYVFAYSILSYFYLFYLKVNCLHTDSLYLGIMKLCIQLILG